MNRPFLPPRYRLIRSALLLAGMLSFSLAHAQEENRLIELVNAYRQSQQTCNGKQLAPAGSLARQPALEKIDVSSSRPLEQALRQAGYQAQKAEAVMISGPGDAAAAMGLLRQRFCSTMMNAAYSDIGIAREGRTWRIVMARPLLSRELGDWQAAGKEILKLTNQARAQARNCGKEHFQAAPPLTWNDRLAAASLAHSKDMARSNYFRHEAPDGSTAGERAKREGYRWSRVGENIAGGQGSPEQAVAGWLSSPGHCANLMRPYFTDMGAAYATEDNSDVVIYWTQVFGTSR